MSPRFAIERLYRRREPVIRDTQRVLILPPKCWPEEISPRVDIFAAARERHVAAVARVMGRAAS